MSCALVTGASGFIGGRLCRRLLTDGVEVHAVSRHPHEDAALRWWQSDLGDADAVARTLEEIRPDVVYHLAGTSQDRESLRPSAVAS